MLQLGRACGFDEPHARNVSRLATNLFDSARQAKLHDFGSWERELLGYAALMHDIGAFLSLTNHHAHTYYLVKNADLLGFDQNEITVMATLGFYHRKKRPKESHRQFSILEPRTRDKVRVLIVLLQMAESLDRSHTGVVRRVDFQRDQGKKIALEIFADQDCQLEVWGVENQKKEFKRTFGLKLSVDVQIKGGSEN